MAFWLTAAVLVCAGATEAVASVAGVSVGELVAGVGATMGTMPVAVAASSSAADAALTCWRLPAADAPSVSAAEGDPVRLLDPVALAARVSAADAALACWRWPTAAAESDTAPVVEPLRLLDPDAVAASVSAAVADPDSDDAVSATWMIVHFPDVIVAAAFCAVLDETTSSANVATGSAEDCVLVRAANESDQPEGVPVPLAPMSHATIHSDVIDRAEVPLIAGDAEPTVLAAVAVPLASTAPDAAMPEQPRAVMLIPAALVLVKVALIQSVPDAKACVLFWQV